MTEVLYGPDRIADTRTRHAYIFAEEVIAEAYRQSFHAPEFKRLRCAKLTRVSLRIMESVGLISQEAQ